MVNTVVFAKNLKPRLMQTASKARELSLDVILFAQGINLEIFQVRTEMKPT